MKPPPPHLDELARFWLDDARTRQIDNEAWAVLIARLRLAAYREQRGEADPALPAGLSSVAAVITAFHDFLQAHDFATAEKLPAITARLMMAVADVAEGRPTPLFKPAYKGISRKRLVEANVSAIAARALDELLKTGQSLDEASQAVNRAVRVGKLAGYTTCSPAKVRNWRFRLEEEDGAATKEALLRYRAPLPPEAGATHQSRAAFLLTALRSSPALRHG